jgi:regulatory protein YycH of two-component signal transduction system YycFG
MDVLIPLVIITVVLAWSVKKFKPELWNKITAKFKK